MVAASKIPANLLFLPVAELSALKGCYPLTKGVGGLSGSPKGVSALPLSYEMKNPVFLINLFFPRKKGWPAAGQYPNRYFVKSKLQRESSGIKQSHQGAKRGLCDPKERQVWHRASNTCQTLQLLQ